MIVRKPDLTHESPIASQLVRCTWCGLEQGNSTQGCRQCQYHECIAIDDYPEWQRVSKKIRLEIVGPWSFDDLVSQAVRNVPKAKKRKR